MTGSMPSDAMSWTGPGSGGWAGATVYILMMDIYQPVRQSGGNWLAYRDGGGLRDMGI